MLNSNERMDFIIEYMSSYDEKIKMANKNGLFDAAKMFELFAIEVCNVWFGQKFSNLNDETATYPYVDLISENRELLVQVSTVQDVPTKIKTTLEKIRDSKDKKCSDLKNIVFFVLSNNSIDKVREYSGDNQIGSISFTIKDNLITTNDIITKAQNDLNFQKKLYKVLKDEYENFNINIRKFKGALELSNSGLKNIEGLINGEYEIDRNEFLEKITKDNERYISIQGGAGSGKTVLCKKYVENEKLVLYARAERFLEENHIDDIWGCCIQDVLECINGKKLIFFIDAYPALVTGLASELCSIADILWLRGKVDAEEFDFYRVDRLSKGFEYGLSEKAEYYNYLYRTDVFDMSNYDISTICYVANCGLNFTNESFRMVIHEILLCVIDIWKYTKRNYNAHEIFDVYQEHEIIELFQREMIQTQDDAKMAIDILFEEIDFTKFTTDTIEFYQDIFGNFLCEFFDSYVDSKRRNICKKKILYIEKKVNDIDEEYVRIQLYKSLMLSVTRYCTGDWSKIKTNYSYVDKQFLNKQFTKYGKYHIKELLRTIYQMHMDELLPEILISIRNSFQNAKSEVNKFKKSIREQEAIVQLIILKSFITYSDKIKQDQELIEAYEDILEILINLNYEQAAVILDEFRIH